MRFAAFWVTGIFSSLLSVSRNDSKLFSGGNAGSGIIGPSFTRVDSKSYLATLMSLLNISNNRSRLCDSVQAYLWDRWMRAFSGHPSTRSSLAAMAVPVYDPTSLLFVSGCLCRVHKFIDESDEFVSEFSPRTEADKQFELIRKIYQKSSRQMSSASWPKPQLHQVSHGTDAILSRCTHMDCLPIHRFWR